MKPSLTRQEEAIKAAKLKLLDDLRVAVITREVRLTTYPSEAGDYNIARLQSLKVAVTKFAGDEMLRVIADKVRELSIIPENLPAAKTKFEKGVKFLATYKKKVKNGRKK